MIYFCLVFLWPNMWPIISFSNKNICMSKQANAWLDWQRKIVVHASIIFTRKSLVTIYCSHCVRDGVRPGYITSPSQKMVVFCHNAGHLMLFYSFSFFLQTTWRDGQHFWNIWSRAERVKFKALTNATTTTFFLFCFCTPAPCSDIPCCFLKVLFQSVHCCHNAYS